MIYGNMRIKYVEKCKQIVKFNIANNRIMEETIDWENVIKKEARGINDFDLGEVQEVSGERVITKKGIVDKDKFYLPKNKVNSFDGDKIRFEVTKEEAEIYRRD